MGNFEWLMRNLKLYFILGSVGIIVLGGGIILLTVGRVFGQYFFGRSFAESQLKDYVSSVLRQEVNGFRFKSHRTKTS